MSTEADRVTVKTQKPFRISRRRMRRFRAAYLAGKKFQNWTDLQKWRFAQELYPFDNSNSIRYSEYWGFLKGARYLKDL